MYVNNPPPNAYIRAELKDLVKRYSRTEDRCKVFYDFLIDHQPLRYLQIELDKGENGYTLQQLYDSRLSLPLSFQSSIADCFRMSVLWNELVRLKQSAKTPLSPENTSLIHEKEKSLREILLWYYGPLIYYKMSENDWKLYWTSDTYGMKKLPKTLKSILGFGKLCGSNEHIMMLIDTVFTPVFPKGHIYAPKSQLYTPEHMLENILYFVYSEPTI